MRRIQRGTCEHYIETQVENKVEEGRDRRKRAGRGPTPSHPIPSHLACPNPPSPTKLSPWETGQVRIVWVSRIWHDTRISHIQWRALANATRRAMEGDRVVMVYGSQMDQLQHCRGSGFLYNHAGAGGTWTHSVVYLPRIHINVQPHVCSTNDTTSNIFNRTTQRERKTHSKAQSGLWLRFVEKRCTHYYISAFCIVNKHSANWHILWQNN